MKQLKKHTWVAPLVLVVVVALSACNPVALSDLAMDAAAQLAEQIVPDDAEQSSAALPEAVEESAAVVPATNEEPVVDAALATNPRLESSDVLIALQDRLQEIYREVNPSVVNIQVMVQADLGGFQMPRLPEGMPGLPDLPFGPSDPGSPGNPEIPEMPPQGGVGSGFVWDTEGHVVTNNHVVDGAQEITVVFADGRMVTAEVVGTDPDSDLAVLKVDVEAVDLVPVSVADSTEVKVGQLAVAIGNPFGLENTMTVGFVSALGRSLPASAGMMTGASYTIPDLIQTDAPINPGNSGGVLVDEQGQVIGVTFAIESPVRANAGIGFAIPSAIVRKVVPVLIADGDYKHSWLGISGTSLTLNLNEEMGLRSDQRGILVMDVTPDGPAEQGGLQGSEREVEISGQPVRVGGDVIVAVDGQPIKEFEDLVAYLARNTSVGQAIELTVLRDGREQSLEVTLAARPEPEERQVLAQDEPGGEMLPDRPRGGTAGGAWLGIQAFTLAPEIASEMDLPEDQQGVLVGEVVPDSPADKAGLRGSSESVEIDGQQVAVGGDVIVAVGGEPIPDMESLVQVVRGAEPGDVVTVEVLREGGQVELPITLGERPAQP
jgi:S1-C subfamily serine protease